MEETLTLGCDHRGQRQPSCLPKTDFSMGLQAQHPRALHPQPGKKAKQQTGTSRWWMGDFMLMRGPFLFLGMSQHPSAAEVWLQAPAVRWSCLEGLILWSLIGTLSGAYLGTPFRWHKLGAGGSRGSTPSTNLLALAL